MTTQQAAIDLLDGLVGDVDRLSELIRTFLENRFGVDACHAGAMSLKEKVTRLHRDLQRRDRLNETDNIDRAHLLRTLQSVHAHLTIRKGSHPDETWLNSLSYIRVDLTHARSGLKDAPL